MEIIFPKPENGYKGLFIVGERKSETGTFEKTGTVILKRTYRINPATGEMSPIMDPDALDLFLTDVPLDPSVENIFQYEHDLAPFKPEGDIIVLGFVPVPSPVPVNVQLKVNNQIRLERDFDFLDLNNRYHLFGWEKRIDMHRQGEGEYNEYGKPKDSFKNRFFNGYLREAIPPFTELPYLKGNEHIKIIRDNSLDYYLTLPGDFPRATFFTVLSDKPDEESHWQEHVLDLKIDTLVIEPEIHRAYLIWRAVWPFGDHDEEAYRRLVVQG